MERQKNRRILISGFVCVALFVLWTLMVKFIDVKPIGPNESKVGFATLNRFVHEVTGVHMALYNITDWLSIIPICFIFGFAVIGLVQLIKRKSVKQVDSDILILGGFYIVVMAVFVFFEYCVVNYRPVLINGVLEASYPSSTTLLVMCVMPTAMIMISRRTKNQLLKSVVLFLLFLFTIFMVAGRLVSGVHWMSDIVGGAVLSAGLVMIFYSLIEMCSDK